MASDRVTGSTAPSALPVPEPAKPVAGPYLPRGRSAPVAPEALTVELVPARMINEVLYCERLMYLEWVQGEWADNVYTAEGRSVHRRVDGKPKALRPAAGERAAAASNGVSAAAAATGSAAPGSTESASSGAEAAAAADRPYKARAVWLSSEQLGITAKIDLVEVDGTGVVPVEYKRGKCPEGPGGPYLPERAQVAAQVLLLRAHGYDCPHGELYYAAERRRVPVQIDQELVDVTLRAAARARELVEQGELPPPLEDSPKCCGCSLAGICLPDETRSLRAARLYPAPDETVFEVGDDPWGLVGSGPEAGGAPVVRRLYAARDDKIPLYVQEQGAAVRLAGDRLVVTRPAEPAVEARLANTSSVNLYGNVQVTAAALRRLMDDGIPVAFHSSGGWFVGRAVGADPKNVELRLAQYRATIDDAFRLRHARCLVASKILNCRALLRRNHDGDCAVTLGELKQLARKAREAPSLEALLGIEGTAARAYFQAFSGMVKEDRLGSFDFERRNRRPPTDPVNALLSFCYGMLSRACALAIASVGLDPLLGFYHRPHFGRPSLALDLMEEFRPVLADSTVIGAINTGVIQADDFTTGAGAVAMKDPGRRRLILAFERRLDQLVTHPIFDYRVSYRRVLEVQARLVGRLVLGELDSFPEFRVR
ncbi:MAG TPA: CRISPR-associated endonuclease Cas1 [Polyangiaceae bacterium]|nr:CRISPR-associated endonuclease Cas1 [Polyangiaceae bacterium]